MTERGQSNDALLTELTEYCRPFSEDDWFRRDHRRPAFTKDGLLAIIERHRQPLNNNDPNINYAFFHEACHNEKSTEGIMRYLIEHFPGAVRHADEVGRLPLHNICRHIDGSGNFDRIFQRYPKTKHVTPSVVKLFIDAFPDSLRVEDNNGYLPLHHFCLNKNLDEEVALKILKLLVKSCPDSVRHTTSTRGNLPIFLAIGYQKSPEFCRILIEAYPGSERMARREDGALPFHMACQYNTVATAKYFHKFYPESINVVTTTGFYPIHYAIAAMQSGSQDAIEIVQFLLDRDPNVALQENRSGKLPLFLVCNYDYEGFVTVPLPNQPSVRILSLALKVLRILYDAYPEVIENNDVTSNIGRFCQEIQTFINEQRTYAQQAKDPLVMSTPDEDGRLPLHKVLQSNNPTLGSIKLLVKGNLNALQSPDNDGALPLHLVCQRDESATNISIVKHLLGVDTTALPVGDKQGNTALHYACRDAKHKMIAPLTEKYGAVSKRSARKELPLQLLLESTEVSDKDGIEYTDSIFRLIRAHPDTVRAQIELHINK